jgi:hypothetical protein
LQTFRKIVFVLSAPALLTAMVTLGTVWGAEGAATAARQAEVATRGAQVMPFDLEQTMHVFESLEDGGLQVVRAKDPANREQIALIQTHLQDEADKFHGVTSRIPPRFTVRRCQDWQRYAPGPSILTYSIPHYRMVHSFATPPTIRRWYGPSMRGLWRSVLIMGTTRLVTRNLRVMPDWYSLQWWISVP